MTPLLFSFFMATAFANIDAKIEYQRARVRLAPPGKKVTAAFLTLKNKSTEDVFLVSASSSIANKVELHVHDIDDNGVMSMREVSKMKLPAKGELVLKPKSNHLMLFGLKQELKEGQQVSFELKFSDGKSETVSFRVEDIRKHKHHH